MTVPRLLLALLFLPSLAIADESEVVPLAPGGAPGYGARSPRKKRSPEVIIAWFPAFTSQRSPSSCHPGTRPPERPS